MENEHHVGQVYQSNDARDKGRKVKLTGKTVVNGIVYWSVERLDTKRKIRIQEKRLGTKRIRDWSLVGSGGVS